VLPIPILPVSPSTVTFVHELVKILDGTGNTADDNNGSHGHDEGAQLTAVLVLSGGGQYQDDENLEAQVLATHCLANLMEALPGVAHCSIPWSHSCAL
jgi:E3 ubiquitin-protein ligase TRIP12